MRPCALQIARLGRLRGSPVAEFSDRDGDHLTVNLAMQPDTPGARG